MRPCRLFPFLRSYDNGCPGQMAAAKHARRPARNRPSGRVSAPAVVAAARYFVTVVLPLRWGRIACLFVVCWVMGGTLSAFGKGMATVNGTVSDPAGAPVEFATITQHRVTDSTVVKSEFSDANEAFALGAPIGGRYLVSVAQVGYERYWSTLFELPVTGLFLPAVALRTSADTMLQEVRVIGQKPLFEHQADRTIVNVENSPLTAGNTALDVLTRAPGVTVDGSDNLALRGKQGLLVLISGKRQPMTGTELADYLRLLPAEQKKTSN